MGEVHVVTAHVHDVGFLGGIEDVASASRRCGSQQVQRRTGRRGGKEQDVARSFRQAADTTSQERPQIVGDRERLSWLRPRSITEQGPDDLECEQGVPLRGFVHPDEGRARDISSRVRPNDPCE